MFKVILKEFKLEKLILKKINKIKIKNLENKLFSESDLIREVESEKFLFINKKLGLTSNFLYKILDFLNIISLKSLNKQISDIFDNNTILILKESQSVKAMNSIIRHSRKKNLNLDKFNAVKYDIKVISFLYDKKIFSFNDLNRLLKKIDNGEVENHSIEKEKEVSDFIKSIIIKWIRKKQKYY